MVTGNCKNKTFENNIHWFLKIENPTSKNTARFLKYLCRVDAYTDALACNVQDAPHIGGWPDGVTVVVWHRRNGLIQSHDRLSVSTGLTDTKDCCT